MARISCNHRLQTARCTENLPCYSWHLLVEHVISKIFAASAIIILDDQLKKGYKYQYRFAHLPSFSKTHGCHLKLVFDEMPFECD